ncbi:TPA: hypothetical protein F3P23_07905 [Aeromonas hydrophila]|nr:hypothetical protein [Aeromonas hydrophila]
MTNEVELNPNRELAEGCSMMRTPHLKGAPFSASAHNDGIVITTIKRDKAVSKERITYSEAVLRLSRGDFDDMENMMAGFYLGTMIMQGFNLGFVASYIELCALYRWFVAAIFIDELIGLNGTVEDVRSKRRRSTVAIYARNGREIPMTLALAKSLLSAHIEREACETGQPDAAAIAATGVYIQMLTEDDKGVCLNQKGRDWFIQHCDALIARLPAPQAPSTQTVQ